ncbi:hypothetical protein M378DRAFT_309202 [Amanita muscaria Koide BX008]|uniref:Uncharacterized protein n=1 Tax=Amanita muscaria (strain Koide BX008) TaxID=946122 RepID=A0A0C2WPM2_AMAMK|nr:hypothetical protein M378DRAFT_309202 [Amanita muscaria Koide BX008]
MKDVLRYIAVFHVQGLSDSAIFTHYFPDVERRGIMDTRLDVSIPGFKYSLRELSTEMFIDEPVFFFEDPYPNLCVLLRLINLITPSWERPYAYSVIHAYFIFRCFYAKHSYKIEA